MTPANYGSVFSCCLFGSLMMLYLYVFCRSKRFILRNGTFVIYLAVGVVMIRMLLPWNFHFAMNVESHKILPFLFDLLRVKILSVEFLTILVIIFCFGSCLRLALYFYKLVRYRHLLHQLDPLDDVRISRIFSDILEEYHCTKQILIYQVPGLSSPAISGLIHPMILLPDREYSDQDLRFIFMHELNHYLHHDLWKSFFWELVVCIYWWNPLSYMIRRLIKDTAEYANDIRLTKDRDELTRTNYMLSLLNTSKQTHTFHTLPTLHFQEGTILNIEKRCDLINDSPKIGRNLFSQFIHIGSISLLFILSLCFIFQPSSPAPNYDNDGTVIYDKPDSSNSFYIKRKDGKSYDLYVKHEDAFINSGIIENPEDYKVKVLKYILAKRRLRNFMKTLNKFIFLFLLSFISIGVFSGSIVSAQDTVSEPSIAVSEEDSSVYSGDVIVWKYKTMNGKLYKRKYNKTTKKWIGNWIPA